MDIKIRKWRMSDLDNLVKYANNPKIAENMTDAFPNPYTEEKGIAFIEMSVKPQLTTLFAIDLEGKTIGGIGLHPKDDIQRKNAELGYWLAEEFWGKGIITQVIPQIVEYGFNNFDIDRIFAKPFGRNIGSQKVLEKSGFILEARLTNTLIKNGQLEDELIYGIRRSQKL